jgi:hypothetical protein
MVVVVVVVLLLLLLMMMMMMPSVPLMMMLVLVIVVMTMMMMMIMMLRTVVASIHQPRSAIFGLFDQLHLLSEGRTVYFGPAAQCVEHLRRLNYTCPADFNPGGRGQS